MAQFALSGLEVKGILTLDGEAVIRVSDLTSLGYFPEVFLTQAAYDALSPPDPNKIYNIVAA